MTLADKVEEINKALNDSFSVTKYSKWELHAFKSDLIKNLEADTFEELIEKAYKIVTGEIITVNGKTYRLIEKEQEPDEIPFLILAGVFEFARIRALHREIKNYEKL